MFLFSITQPFGVPVVPDVYRMANASSGEGDRSFASGASPANRLSNSSVYRISHSCPLTSLASDLSAISSFTPESCIMNSRRSSGYVGSRGW